ncbi:hypothetical protein E2C01_085288 [Portunus trituberculatus]|uniref:Uncharacterized protein n=1 Tax=Portunus trituberculatus TaxID=210409 RepID=A0A5B7IXF7_PORTR|nr:hypothetical protein [Portunus trituberculatus]
MENTDAGLNIEEAQRSYDLSVTVYACVILAAQGTAGDGGPVLERVSDALHYRSLRAGAFHLCVLIVVVVH